ncbi:uncharacterized protein LOC135370271 [Ornithodoros turicata]|uniref:uncharacterized protein LOC135370271 n=1 Tax=Ornithodoros turicata TaxID=34597 RepID=UPI003139FA77
MGACTMTTLSFFRCASRALRRQRRVFLLGCVAFGTLICVQKRVNVQFAHLFRQTPQNDTSKSGTARNASEALPIRKFIVETSGCSIPNFDHFDISVKGFYKKVGQYECPGKASFIRMVNLTVPVADGAVLKKNFGYTLKDINCTYFEICRSESVRLPDKTYFYKKGVPFFFGSPLESEYGYVSCKAKRKVFHEEFFLVPLLKKDVEEQCKRIEDKLNSTLPRLNVLILGIDSVSRLNFNRHLPLSGKFVREVLKAYEFFGYNKVGLNSFPNQTPLLTGLSGDEAKNISGKKFYDGLNFLWKEYKKRGYRTMFLEETLDFGLYTYNRNGFKRAPTDYYTRHAGLAIEKRLSRRKKTGGYCVGSKAPMTLYLDYFLGLTKVWKDRPFIVYLWTSELAHSGLNNAGHSDTPFLNVLRALHERGVLNNTVLAFMSDHGLRFGSLRNTYIGRFEDSLPFAFLAFPYWFLRQYPDYARALSINQRRLTTHYDMHATFLQLRDFPRMTQTITKRGLSLFYEVPENRTCASASVPIQFCACEETLPFPDAHPLARQVATFVLSELNRMIGKELKGKCHKWKLKEVVSIRFYKPEGRQSNKTITDYWIRVAASPDGGLFEATVRHSVDWKASTFTMAQQPDRVDWYSSHAKCAKGKSLAMYCYCKKA